VRLEVQARLSQARLFGLSLFWFATSAHWTAILLILLPTQALLVGGNDFKGRTLGLVILFGALISTIVAPLAGALSDRSRSRFGRRRPYILLGGLANALALLALGSVQARGATGALIVWFILVELFNNLATAPYAALIPDLVSPAQRGQASGWMGLMTMLGNLTGALLGLSFHGLGLAKSYALLAGLIALGSLLTVVLLDEPPAPRAEPKSFLSPFRSSDFTWVLLTRLFVMMGTYSIEGFTLYYIRSVVDRPYTLLGLRLSSPQAANSLFLLALLLGAAASTLSAGALSDRLGRKPLIYLSGALQVGALLAILAVPHLTPMTLLALVFGLGYGAYASVDWALASDALPHPPDYAKDMGIWHLASTMPQVLATPLAGLALDALEPWGRLHGFAHLGYDAIFALGGFWFLLGLWTTRWIRGIQ